ncbi:MAG: hypothetical protein RLY61_805 [Candidatus Parcubacteria bacterium]|jgi:LPXTG-site transpeptidase (sortase) family protein
MSYFRPTVIQKKVESENLFTKKNPRFWSNSAIVPYLPFLVSFVLIVTQVMIPLYFFKTAETDVPAPVKASILGYSSGFRNYSFNELNEQSPNILENANVPRHFYLTVPKLEINAALVKTNSTDLSPDGFIGHYNGSSLPGDGGTTYLYGHSVLPFFYNPKNYNTIFSKLNMLTKDDELYVTYNNIKHTYKVVSTKQLAIGEVKPLENKRPAYLNESSLVLMTCWPAGTKLKRFEVLAVKVD